MEVVLNSIGDKGDLTNERFGLKVLKKCSLEYFFLFKTQMITDGFAHKSKDAYWFLPQEVLPGDVVVLYSKVGEKSVKINDDGTKTYFFYWGLSTSIFQNANDIIVLGSLKNWEIIK